MMNLVKKPEIFSTENAYAASVVAYDFVRRGIDEGNPVTQMKLQKLIYFAHGLHLAALESPLTNENFQAWKFGPVIPNVYQEYKLFGSNPILDKSIIAFQGKKEPDLNCIDKDSLSFIEIAWQTLNKFSGTQLSNWTHNEGSPWKKYYDANKENVVIPNEAIRSYFSEKFTKK